MYIIYLHSHRHNIVEKKQQSKNKNVAHIVSILLGFFLLLLFVFVFCVLCSMLPVSLSCPFLIALPVFCDVY